MDDFARWACRLFLLSLGLLLLIGVIAAAQAGVSNPANSGYDSVTTTASADAVMGNTHYIDTSAGNVTLTLPDVAASNDGASVRFVLVDNTNRALVTTTSGTGLIGGLTSQAIIQNETGFTVKSDNTAGVWHIIQDSRAKSATSNLLAYGLTESGAVGGYNRLAFSTGDSDYSGTAQNFALPAITGADVLLGGWVGDQGQVEGLLSDSNIDLVFSVRRTSGTAGAYFYVKYYHRTSGGTETLIGTSGISQVVTASIYEEHDIAALIAAQNFDATDYLVIKFYGTKSGTGSNPVYDVKLEGYDDPARASISVPSSIIQLNQLSGAVTDAQVPNDITVNWASEYCVALSDQTSDLTTGTGKATLYLPSAATVNSVRAYDATAGTGAAVTVDINEAGTTILSTKITIDAGEQTSGTAATPAVISDSALAANAKVTFDIDQVGSTVAGAGLVACLDVTF